MGHQNLLQVPYGTLSATCQEGSLARRYSAIPLTGPLLRAGRALAGLSAQELAEASKVGLRTIRRAEQEGGLLSATEANQAALVSALAACGVELLLTPVGPAVALKTGFKEAK